MRRRAGRGILDSGAAAALDHFGSIAVISGPGGRVSIVLWDDHIVDEVPSGTLAGRDSSSR
jgi:hypothetical protein